MPSARARTYAAVLSLCASLSPAVAAAQTGVTLVPPHRAMRLTARPDAALRAAVEREVTASPPRDVDAAIEFAVRLTAAHLHFGLRHRTSTRFGVVEREAHCVEYAQLFAWTFNTAARVAHLTARATPYRSDARVFGLRVPDPALADHDWVRVVDGARRWHVDPTFADVGLGWNIADRFPAAAP